MTSAHILQFQGVSVSFDGFKVLDNLDFSIEYGELRFLIGPNGAGKTTLLDIITGKTMPESGKVVFDQHDNIQRVPEYKRVKYGIGRKFQTPSIFGSLSVLENLEAAVGFKSRIDRLLRPMTADEKVQVESTLELIGLTEQAHKRAGTLSHGQKQWLEIGMILIQEPKLMLLDEPVAGMSRGERDRTGQLLQAIGKNRSVLVVEHDMVFVRQFATTVTVLHMGRLLCEGPVAQVQSDPRVVEVYLGRGHEEARAHA
jgi:urea transport system ATP-binding protein